MNKWGLLGQIITPTLAILALIAAMLGFFDRQYLSKADAAAYYVTKSEYTSAHRALTEQVSALSKETSEADAKIQSDTAWIKGYLKERRGAGQGGD